MAPSTRSGRTPVVRERAGEGAFTLLELITVVALVSILAAIALPQYKVAIIQAKEATLREDLYRFRDLIDQYQADKGKYPASLEALVQEGYLRRIPEDPITRVADWEAVFAEPDADKPGEVPGVFDVKSSSTLVSLSGTPYNEW
jgi:general secretion pathway protein G